MSQRLARENINKHGQREMEVCVDVRGAVMLVWMQTSRWAQSSHAVSCFSSADWVGD